MVKLVAAVGSVISSRYLIGLGIVVAKILRIVLVNLAADRRHSSSLLRALLRLNNVSIEVTVALRHILLLIGEVDIVACVSIQWQIVWSRFNVHRLLLPDVDLS